MKQQEQKPKHTRIRQQDMLAAMYRPKDHMTEADITVENVLVFTLFGKHDELTDERGIKDQEGYPVLADKGDIFAEDLDEAYAKSIKIGHRIKYYIKTEGSGRLFNPMGLYTELQSTKTKHVGLPVYKFIEVGYTTFSHYLKFLRTQNIAWLLTAQRELI